MRRKILFALSFVLVGVFISGGAFATAGSLIGSKDIKDRSIQQKDLAPGVTSKLNKTGKPGPVGPQGPAGTPGANGKDGANGINGAKGLDGAQGPAGRDGTNGAPGANGRDGEDGAQGPQGPQGEPGTDASVALYTNGIGGRRAADVDTDAGDYTLKGTTQTTLTVPAGTYMITSSVSAIAPAVDGDGGLISRTRCNLVNATDSANIDTFYASFYNNSESGTPGYRVGINLGAQQTFASETVLEVRCFALISQGSDPGEIGAAKIDALKLGAVNPS
jgi:hypothetical protein